MIEVRVDKPKGKRNYIIYLKCKYNKEIISIIKTFPGATFNSGQWEVPFKYFNSLVDSLSEFTLEFYGKLPKSAEDYLDQLDQFDSAQEGVTYKPKTKPYEHQYESFKYSLDHRKFLLADEQGLGKTKQSIDIAVSKKGQFKHCLIVCGVNGLKWNWKKEVEIHSNEKAHILGEYTNSKGKTVIGSVDKRLKDLSNNIEEFFIITNVETLRNKKIAEQLRGMCQEGIIGMTIIDEIHKCKNSTSVQGKAIHNLCSYYKIALTGTPLMNSPIDLYNILKWLDKEPHNLTQFKAYYCNLGSFNEIVSYKHLDVLQASLDSCMLRRKKEEVLDLPPKIRTTEYVEMGSKQSKIYKDVQLQIQKDIDRILLSPNPLVELLRLRQCTGHPAILSSEVKESCKIERLIELADEVVQNKDKLVVFSNWTTTLDPAIQALKQYNPAVITGETKNRQQEQDRFQNDDKCKVILGTISAMGTGLTLTAGSTIIFLDSPWTRADKDQAEDRCHRIGTTKPVNIITLVCKDTIDERIESILNGKGYLSDIIVDKFNNTNKIDMDTLQYLIS